MIDNKLRQTLNKGEKVILDEHRATESIVEVVF